MRAQQKALIVSMEGERARGLDELNIALGRGWRVVHAAPMGGAGAFRREVRFASLVVIEREDDVLAENVRFEEEVEEPAAEGDGSTNDAVTDFGERT
jgi:hypothetical protein